MNTLHFYTRRIFALVCLFFFGFLILIASRSPSANSATPALSSKEWARQAHVLQAPKSADYNAHPKHLKAMARRPGEQLAFQPQVEPAAGLGLVPYSELGVARRVDEDKLRRLDVHLRSVDLDRLAAAACPTNTTLARFWSEQQGREVPQRDNWERFYSQIGSCDLYRDERLLQDLLDDLSRMPLKHVAIMEGGTQTKLVFTFDNDKQAVFKPMRFGRDYETDPNHFYFGDFERHQAEIATFHLDRVLGFRRAVPTVGRVLNMTGELWARAEKRLKKTFFLSPAGNQCFVGKCDYYCDTTHAICGAPDLKEGSVQVFLPDDVSVPRRHNKSPYRRTYSKKNQLAEWQTNMDYCETKVKSKMPYAHGRGLLDLVDLHIMDYLIGNQDRHHYETFSVFGDLPAYAMHLDNGRAFGKTKFDDHDILLPLRQCCVIRPSTMRTLLRFYKGPKSLTEALHESMSRDPVAPVLAYKHYPALERRLDRIMAAVLRCMDERGGAEAVLLNDFHNPSVARPAPGARRASAAAEEDEGTQHLEPALPAEQPPFVARRAADKPPLAHAPAPDQRINPDGQRIEESA